MKKNLIFLLAFLALCLVCLASCEMFEFRYDGVHFHKYDDWAVLAQPTCTENGKRERYCSCGAKQTFEMARLGHDFISHAGKDATCSVDGYEPFLTCRRCEFSTRKVIAAHGHDLQEFPYRAPTCEQAGVSEHRACLNCGYSTAVEIPAVGHSFGEWEVTVTPSCETEGEETRACINNNCTLTQTRALPATGHSEGEWECETEADCDKDGHNVKRCIVCGNVTDTQCVAALGHDFGEWAETVSATCAQGGEEARVCSRDHTHIQTRTIPKKPHSVGDFITVIEPECDNDGQMQRLCADCGFVAETQTVPAIGHDYGEWRTALDADCTQAGREERVCSVCNDIDARTTEPLGHNYVWECDENSHRKVCENCFDKQAQSPHNFADGVCGDCGYAEEDESGLSFELNGESYTITGLKDTGISQLTIPEFHNGIPVTAIAPYAFRNCVSLNTVYVPECITKIGECAFAGCTNLMNITLPFIGGSVDGEGWFGYIFGAQAPSENTEYVPSGLTTINIIGNISGVSVGAFFGCENLRSVTLPDSVTVIGESAFNNCTALESVALPQNLLSIESQAFFNCVALDGVKIPKAVGHIGEFAFYNCTFERAEFEKVTGWCVYSNGENKGAISESMLEDLATAAQLLTRYYYNFTFKRT